MSPKGPNTRSLHEVCKGYVFYVCLSVHSGGWYPSIPCRWYPSMSCRSPGGVSQHTLEVSRPTPKGELERSGQKRVGGRPQAHTGEGSPDPHPGGGCIPACTETDPPADGYCCERYTSYWNAFFFH